MAEVMCLSPIIDAISRAKSKGYDPSVVYMSPDTLYAIARSFDGPVELRLHGQDATPAPEDENELFGMSVRFAHLPFGSINLSCPEGQRTWEVSVLASGV